MSALPPKADIRVGLHPRSPQRHGQLRNVRRSPLVCGTVIRDVGCRPSPAAALPKASVARDQSRSRLDSEGSAAMPDQLLHLPSERETILASILKSRLDLRRLQSDLHDTVSRSRKTISQSLDVIAKADEVLAQK